MIYPIGIVATSVVYDARWKIFVDEDNPYGYVVQNQGNSSLTMALNLSTGNVYTAEYSGSSLERWYFDKLTDAEVESLEGIIVYGDSAVKVGSSTQLVAGVFSTETLNQGATYYSNYSAATTTSAGYVTGVSEGSVTIGVTSSVDPSVTGAATISIVTGNRNIAVMIGIPSSSSGVHDHSSHFIPVANSIRSIYNSTAGISTYTSISDGSYAAAYMKNSDVFVYRGHGTATTIVFGDSNLYSPIMSNADIGAGEMRELSNSDLVLYCCCLCGAGGETANNLVVATYKNGAKNVIGFKTTINCADATRWIKAFFASLSAFCNDGEITTSAISSALNDISDEFVDTDMRKSNTLFLYN